jgi:hypothetical protein
MRRMPGHKRRTKTKARIDVTRVNANRVTVRNGKLTLSSDDGRLRQRIEDEKFGGDDLDHVFDSVTVLIAAGRQIATIECQLRHERAIRRVARKHSVRIVPVEANGTTGIIVLSCDGNPDDMREFASHIAGHSDLSGVGVILTTLSMATSGTQGHLGKLPTILDEYRDNEPAESIYEPGSSIAGKRIDYNARRGDSKATYRSDNRRNINDLDHIDTRSGKSQPVRSLRTPDLPHTER